MHELGVAGIVMVSMLYIMISRWDQAWLGGPPVSSTHGPWREPYIHGLGGKDYHSVISVSVSETVCKKTALILIFSMVQVMYVSVTKSYFISLLCAPV